MGESPSGASYMIGTGTLVVEQWANAERVFVVCACFIHASHSRKIYSSRCETRLESRWRLNASSGCETRLESRWRLNASSGPGPDRFAKVGEGGSAPNGGQHSAIDLLILAENSACRVPNCAAAACWLDHPHQEVFPGSRIPRSTSHFVFVLRSIYHFVYCLLYCLSTIYRIYIYIYVYVYIYIYIYIYIHIIPM